MCFFGPIFIFWWMKSVAYKCEDGMSTNASFPNTLTYAATCNAGNTFTMPSVTCVRGNLFVLILTVLHCLLNSYPKTDFTRLTLS